MTFASDDLTPFLAPPRGEHAGWVQGVIRAWDRDTFENVIHVDGADLRDLPVMSGVEALTYEVGDVVMLARWQPGGGLASYWVVGRALSPAMGAAERAIAAFTTKLGQAVAAAALGSRVHPVVFTNTGTRNDTSYGDLSGPDPELLPAPVVAGVPISASGVAIVAVGCEMTTHLDAGRLGLMSYDVDGPTTRAANDSWAYSTGVGGDTDLSVSPSIGAGRVTVQTGLAEGIYTFTAQYRTLTTDGDVTFAAPYLIVIGL